MDPRWKHPFTCVLAGNSGSGKTTFMERFLIHQKEMMLAPAPLEEIVWCYGGAWQPAYERMERAGLVTRFEEGLMTVTADNNIDGRPKLIVIDDLMCETDQRVTKLFTKDSHHQNISVIYIVQNLFGKNKEQRTISLNSHYLVIFKNPRDASQITHLAKQMYPGRVKYMQEAYKDATDRPHGYLLVDLTQSCPDQLRLRTGIFPDDDQHVVYVPQ